jgi:hypothetical protein
MTLGVIFLVHDNFERAAQSVQIWQDAGCPVVIHVDATVPHAEYSSFKAGFAGVDSVRFCTRHRCEWGMWGIVAATQEAAEVMVSDYPDVQHVYLSSGSCLPLRPISELRSFLASHPSTDFIDSATTADVSWAKGGLQTERFTLRFPFSWKTHRKLFDRYVDFQRRLGVRRKTPGNITPHLGSQWWCLTRRTLSSILTDPDREKFDRFFRKTWIPDESYFQTMARLHSTNIESRSLTYSKFDVSGKPHVFYEDHIPLLRQSQCFVARKIWPSADAIYSTFPNNRGEFLGDSAPRPSVIEREFAKAEYRHNLGRPGLFMQSKFPWQGWEKDVTARGYSVFQGFSQIFEDFEDWLDSATGCVVHGRLFAPTQVEFEKRQRTFAGALSDNVALRDYDPSAFLINLVWNVRDHRQCFQMTPEDNQSNTWLMSKDPNAHISVIAGAWLVPLARSGYHGIELRRVAAAMQRREAEFLEALRSPWAKATVHIWSLAEFADMPLEHLQLVVDEISELPQKSLTTVPRMADLSKLGPFIQKLRNQGMPAGFMSDFAVDANTSMPKKSPQRPYLVQ